MSCCEICQIVCTLLAIAFTEQSLWQACAMCMLNDLSANDLQSWACGKASKKHRSKTGSNNRETQKHLICKKRSQCQSECGA